MDSEKHSSNAWQHVEPLNDCVCSVVEIVCKLEIASVGTFQPVTYLSDLFIDVAVKNTLRLHFGDYNQYRLAKLMFCTITTLYTFCYTFFQFQ